MEIRNLTAVVGTFLALISCSKKEHEGVRMFYGACKVEVVSKTSDSEIFVDGVNVGEEHAKVEIPCGEKQITVTKEGFAPYRAYLPVTSDQPLKVTVQLEKVKSHDDYALSSELISQVKKGEPLIDPDGDAAQKAMAVKYAEIRKTTEAAAYQAKADSGGAAASGGAATQSWNSVDDWR